MKDYSFYVLLLSLFLSPYLAAYQDFEKMAQDFVLETKKIEIPGYPTAFNPSIIRWNGSILMSFRTRDPLTHSSHLVGFVWVDEEFNLMNEPQLIDVSDINPYLPERLQDSRLVSVGEDLYVVYNNVIGPVELEIRRIFIAKLCIDGDRFYFEDIESIQDFEGVGVFPREKNWTPFAYEGNILLAYSIEPHLVFQPLRGTSSCKTVSRSSGGIKWDWGQLRGGTPAFLQDSEYLAFFHSSKDVCSVQSEGRKITHYFMGAYTFCAKPPFAITKISPEPIVADNFYSGPAYNTWKPLRVIFPCGYIIDENFVWISYGKQDHEVWMVKLDRKGLIDSLVPISALYDDMDSKKF